MSRHLSSSILHTPKTYDIRCKHSDFTEKSDQRGNGSPSYVVKRDRRATTQLKETVGLLRRVMALAGQREIAWIQRSITLKPITKVCSSILLLNIMMLVKELPESSFEK